ncbi:hypothetical protein J6590_076499 [Homalodisca vitripennis]|nr:hypothetical protein J6590_076499 [Homalodisca vitripennis]
MIGKERNIKIVAGSHNVIKLNHLPSFRTTLPIDTCLNQIENGRNNEMVFRNRIFYRGTSRKQSLKKTNIN